MQISFSLSHDEADALYRLNRRLLDGEIAQALAPCDPSEIKLAIEARNRLCVALHGALEDSGVGMVNGHFAQPQT